MLPGRPGSDETTEEAKPTVSAEARKTAASRTCERVAGGASRSCRSDDRLTGSVLARRRKARLTVVGVDISDGERGALDGRREPGRIRRIPRSKARELCIHRVCPPTSGAGRRELGESNEQPGRRHDADDRRRHRARRLRQPRQPRRGTRSRGASAARLALVTSVRPGREPRRACPRFARRPSQTPPSRPREAPEFALAASGLPTGGFRPALRAARIASRTSLESPAGSSSADGPLPI